MKRNHLSLVKSLESNVDKHYRKLQIIKEKSERMIMHPLFLALPIDHCKYIAIHHNTDNVVWTDADIELMIKGLDVVLIHMDKIKPHRNDGIRGR